MKGWRQTRHYTCPRCLTIYLHDESYTHHSFICPDRRLTNAQRLQQFLKSGKVYAPVAEKSR